MTPHHTTINPTGQPGVGGQLGAEVKSKRRFGGSSESRGSSSLAYRTAEEDADKRVVATRHAGSGSARSSHDFACLRLHATRVELGRGVTDGELGVNLVLAADNYVVKPLL